MLTASDPDGDALTFSISGADAPLFTLNTASGALTATEILDFETPSDSNADNSYEITARVSDGTASVSFDVTVMVENIENDGLLKIPGVSIGDAFGASLSDAPDLDGDGETELFVGNLKSSPSSPPTENIAYLLFSSALGAETATEVDLAGLNATQRIEFFVDNLPTSNVIFGLANVARAIAPPNAGWGEEYLLVHQPGGNGSDAGVAAFFPGAIADIQAVDRVDHGSPVYPDGVRDSRSNRDFSTSSQADRTLFSAYETTGDFDGDGATDIVLKNFKIDDLTTEDILIVSGTQLLNGTGGAFARDLFNAPAFGGGAAVVIQLDAGFENGLPLVNAGDVNGDGADDLMLSVSQTGSPSTHRFYVLSGKALFDDADGILALSDLSFPDIIEIDPASVATQPDYASGGDFDGDGLADVVISSLETLDIQTGELGAAYVLYADALLADADGVTSLAELPGPKGVFIVKGDGAEGGVFRAAGVGDINGEGLDDLLISTHVMGVGQRSTAFLLFGEFLDTIGDQAVRLDESLAGKGLAIIPLPISQTTTLSHDLFAYDAVRALDVDGDGVEDLVIGAPGEGAISSVGAWQSEASGAVYVLPSSRLNAEAMFDGVLDLDQEF